MTSDTKMVAPPLQRHPSLVERSELGLALALGGGVDVRLWRGLGGGVEIRWLQILRAYDALDTAQVAARASYRF